MNRLALDDAPTPRPTPRTERLLPVLRQSMTFNPPEDDNPVTIEVIITTGGDGTAEVSDLPELRDAGWGTHLMGTFSVHFRIVN